MKGMAEQSMSMAIMTSIEDATLSDVERRKSEGAKILLGGGAGGGEGGSVEGGEGREVFFSGPAGRSPRPPASGRKRPTANR
jgi:hypothetical protein